MQYEYIFRGNVHQKDQTFLSNTHTARELQYNIQNKHTRRQPKGKCMSHPSLCLISTHCFSRSMLGGKTLIAADVFSKAPPRTTVNTGEQNTMPVTGD